MSRTSAVGTWVLNEEITPPIGKTWFAGGNLSSYYDGGIYEIAFTQLGIFGSYFGVSFIIVQTTEGGETIGSNIYYTNGDTTQEGFLIGADYEYITPHFNGFPTIAGIHKTSETGIKLRTFTITGGEDVANADLIEWLEANATYVESNIEVSMTSPDGVTLATEGKYVPANVKVTPALQEKTVTESGDVTPDEGYVGLSKVTVDVGSSLTTAEGVEF